MFRKVGWPHGRGGGQLFRAFDKASGSPACGAVAGLAGLRGALGLRMGAGAGSFGVVVPRLDAGLTGIQRGRKAMQLFPLRGE